MESRYRLHELISRRMPLSEINEAFDLLRNGEVKRSVIVYE
jgi:S-(hydroxymethyl)glutathione dehydrogenase/alcohol dehydrogenase